MKRPSRRAALSLLVPAVGAVLVACGDDSNLTQDATLTNTIVGASLYAITGSPPETQAAYVASSNTFIRPTVSATGSTNFELAVDIMPDGKVLLIPARAIVPLLPPASGSGSTLFPSAPSLSLLRSGQGFDLLSRAPSGNGYVTDSVQVASAGETFILRLNSSGCTFGEPLYGKFVIDSVIVSQRRLVVRAMTNRNCGGYRSLAAGSIPKD
ncbi:MAG: hypothetical protein ACO1Q7_07900 [Gemmatimonas sp.]